MLNKMCLDQEMLATWHVIRNEEQVLWKDLRTHGSPFLQQIMDIDITQIHCGLQRAVVWESMS